MASIVL